MTEVVLKEQRYGKDRVRLIKVIRTGKWHEVIELTVRVLLEGEFETSYTHGDNSKVVATDTMKNTVYVLAKKTVNIKCIELFATEIGKHFVNTYSHVTKASVLITKHRWTRMLVDGKLHDHSFARDGEETRITEVVVKRDKVEIKSGLKGLLVLKTTGSAFYGFHRDQYTTLPESTDRILSTVIDATWTYSIPNPSAISKIPYCTIFDSIRKLTLDTFATDDSVSVQATLYLMAKRILEIHKEVTSVSYGLPNKHCFAFDLERFGLKNSGADTDIYVPFEDPSGLITATVERVKSKL
ncbi:595_t:CDS:2 [Paraglomus brasilianum]|uniref:Uricase n=1 Tax=Paraglomus brasilianum TaxID=144538 RepID=A0A9N8WJ80_9GLOM|nr:595_t:CDS:2 [Paraglomus brasilianum]